MYGFIIVLLGCQLTLGDYPFRNASLPWSQRTEDLVNRLTLDEVILQLSKGGAGKFGGPAPAIPRLGIRPYQWNTECLRGAVQAGAATSFPQAINLAATFDPDLVHKVANATAVEVRAKHNWFMAHKNYSDHTGLGCFAPVINIMRHPNWGRNQETYGEDPHLTGTLAESYVRGLQGSHPRYVLANSVCKHFAAHDGPEDRPIDRLRFNAVVSPRDLEMTFLPQFERCVGAGAMGVMCSYNRLNGVPSCANPWLLTEVLRQRWNFTGYVVSDEGALEFMVIFHHSFKTLEDAAVAAVYSGVNLELAPQTDVTVYAQLKVAVEKGRIKEARLRELLRPLVYTRLRLGEFDPPSMNPFNQYNVGNFVQCANHRFLSIRAAKESFVLLKNQPTILPITAKVKRMAVIGPFAVDMTQLYGDYSADRMPNFEIPVAQGLKTLCQSQTVASVCTNGPPCTTYNATLLKETLKDADLVILTVGTGQILEAENVDKWNMTLPGKQPRLLEDVLKYSNAPVILLVFTASPVDLRSAVANQRVRAILWCGFPAQTAGAAIADVLSAKYVPAGRLPFTWYQTSDQAGSITDYKMTNKTYRYFSGLPLFPFGYGLSFVNFRYDNLSVARTVKKNENITVGVYITNMGKYTADEVTQVYISWPASYTSMPQRQLVDFKRSTIPKLSRKMLNFTITPRQRRVWGDNQFEDFAGLLIVFVGGQQPNQVVTVSSNVLKSVVKVM